VNNYLSSIAARALNPVPPVRPRLRGRFDPAPLINEAAVDRLDVTPAESLASEPPVEINRRATFENQRGRRHAQPRQPFDVAIEPDALPLPPRDSEASSDSKRDISELPPQSPTIQMPIAKATIPKTQPTRPVSVAEAAPIESHIEHAKEVAPAIQTTRVSASSSAGSRVKIIATAVREPNSDAQAQPDLAASRPHSLTTDRPPLQHSEEQRALEPRTDQPKLPHQREIKTIVVREQKILERSAHARHSSPSALTVPALSSSSQPARGDAKPSPVVVQSRIAPLVEKGAESFSLSRPVPQPQPTVRVTIGRVEVRAVQSSQSPAKPRTTPPVMNLDDYLRRRNQGSAR
jgi:hypothetical protein